MSICIDYSLFFRHGGRDIAARRQTLHAVLVCTGSTIVAFITMLALSFVPVLQTIGLTVAIGVSASFILALGLARQLAGSKNQKSIN
jgi:predicted exporter